MVGTAFANFQLIIIHDALKSAFLLAVLPNDEACLQTSKNSKAKVNFSHTIKAKNQMNPSIITSY